jgi:hypothetical protein
MPTAKKNFERGPAADASRERFIDRFDPPIAELLRESRSAMREHFPTAVELVYDNYNALAIGWAPSERASEVIVSVAGFPRGVSLYFTHGAKLDDPDGLLEGGGRQGRFIRLERAAQLKDPRVVALLNAARALGKTPLPDAGEGFTVIKSVSAKQRPRRATPKPGRRVKSRATQD